MVGSFLNVLVARLPYEKSVLWPGSRCFSCFRPIRPLDNLPIVGYLRLRGRCRFCKAEFSARYLWVEVGTGLAFLGLFLWDVVFNVHGLPGARYEPVGGNTAPSAVGLAVFGYHAVLVSCLIAAAVIDAGHRIIPPAIPFTGALVGIVGGALMPWPWPHPAAEAVAPTAAAVAAGFTPAAPWSLSECWGRIPVGVQPWPFWGPLPAWLPAGSWKLGLVNGFLGALAGSLVVRWIKWLFETGFGREALGLGDADLLFLAGAFLGWQPAVLSLFAGAFAALLVFKLPAGVVGLFRGREFERELPFGPGLAVGVVATWLAWPWVGPRVQFVFLDLRMLAVVVGLVSVGMLAAGLLLRRKDDAPTPEPATR